MHTRSGECNGQMGSCLLLISFFFFFPLFRMIPVYARIVPNQSTLSLPHFFSHTYAYARVHVRARARVPPRRPASLPRAKSRGAEHCKNVLARAISGARRSPFSRYRRRIAAIRSDAMQRDAARRGAARRLRKTRGFERVNNYVTVRETRAISICAARHRPAAISCIVAKPSQIATRARVLANHVSRSEIRD